MTEATVVQQKGFKGLKQSFGCSTTPFAPPHTSIKIRRGIKKNRTAKPPECDCEKWKRKRGNGSLASTVGDELCSKTQTHITCH